MHFLIFTLFFSISLCDLKVYSPANLGYSFPANSIPFTLANFGHIPYGRTLIAPLFLADPILGCHQISPINSEEIKEAPFIIMRRGDCTFVTKVKNAQSAGAKMAIIVDDKSENAENITMIDDGFSFSVSIPSIFISKQSGDILIQALNSPDETKRNVVLTINFENRVKSDEVNAVFWLSTSNRNSFRIINEFYQYFKKLENRIKFTPHYAIWVCHSCLSSNFTIDNENCISGGRYCCPDPDGTGPATGAHIVQEDLRQICIWKKYQDKWWEYMMSFDDECVEYQVVKECSLKVMKKVGIDSQVIQECFDGSFIKTGNLVNYQKDDNSILSDERREFVKNGIQFWPSVSLNSEQYKGNLIGESIFEATCSFLENIPEVCYEVLEVKINEEKEGISIVTIVIVVLSILVAFFFFLVCIYRRWIKKELSSNMNAQVNQMVSQYIAFYENREKKNLQGVVDSV
jgi:hypothetical protein